MADEKTSPTAEELKQKADAEFEASLEGLSEEEKTQKRAEKEAKDHSQIDYDAEIAREKERTRIAEQKLAETNFKLREEKRKKEEQKIEGEEEKEDEGEKPLTRQDLQTMLAANQRQLYQNLMGDTIKRLAREMTKSEAEANYVAEIYKNRIWPEDMPIEEQLEEACAIANRKPFMTAQRAEIDRAKKSKETSSTENLGTFKDSQPVEEPRLDANAKKALTGAGFTWDGKRRLYVKLVSKDRILTYDPKTNKRQVITK